MSDNPVFDIFKILSTYKSVGRYLSIAHASITNLVTDEENKVTDPIDFAYRRFCGKQQKILVGPAVHRRLSLETKVMESIEKSKKK
jgi:hypothetical protein